MNNPTHIELLARWHNRRSHAEDDAICASHIAHQHRATATALRAMEKALIKLRDCDWVITPHDRMDAVRDIASEALQPPKEQQP